MAIELNDGSRSAAPVIRQQRLAEVAYLAIVRPDQRDRLRKNQSSGAMEPIPNGSDRQCRPKVKQEMVVHAIAMPGTTMEARIGDEGGVPAAGDRVRAAAPSWQEADGNPSNDHSPAGLGHNCRSLHCPGAAPRAGTTAVAPGKRRGHHHWVEPAASAALKTTNWA
ncbi:MAG: hypothetical protein VKK63_08740 [Synechococcus sp.]|nr:hypothetical protein [Synechococcus sp.]